MSLKDKILEKVNSTNSAEGAKWTIGKRILFLTVTASVVIMIVGAISIFSLTKINAYADEIANAYIAEWGTASALEVAVRKAGYEHLQYSNSNNEEYIKSALDRFEKIEGEYAELEEYEQTYDLPLLTAEIGNLKTAIESYKLNLQAFREANEELATTNDLSQLNALTSKLEQAKENADQQYQNLLAISSEINQAAEDGARELAALTSSTVTNYRWIITVVG
ncbi:MAG TPA: hypothetical protein DD671_07360, partial [Balneolaceae bacterium]|nr:hypothetical protein [Balneolaceae bacterium]